MALSECPNEVAYLEQNHGAAVAGEGKEMVVIQIMPLQFGWKEANCCPSRLPIVVPSYTLMGISQGTPSSAESLSLTPLGEACSRMDLTAIHEILGKVGYKDDKGIANELSFQMWTNQMQETLNSKKHGDTAFRAKDFANAIDNYTQFIDVGTMVSPTVFGRRCLSYLMYDMPQEALADAMHSIFRQPPYLPLGWMLTPKSV